MKIENVKATIEADKKYKTGKIREQNYQIILDAAEISFAQQGFKGASMMAIANQAGLPKANIHYYFKNKTDLTVKHLDQTFYLNQNENSLKQILKYLANVQK